MRRQRKTVEGHRRQAVSASHREHSGTGTAAGAWILALQPPRLWGSTSLWLKPPCLWQFLTPSKPMQISKVHNNTKVFDRIRINPPRIQDIRQKKLCLPAFRHASSMPPTTSGSRITVLKLGSEDLGGSMRTIMASCHPSPTLCKTTFCIGLQKETSESLYLLSRQTWKRFVKMYYTTIFPITFLEIEKL